MTTSALIFAGGTGSRMNTKTLPKQFLELHGKPIIIHTIEHFEDHPAVSDIVVVCVDGWLDYCRDLLARFNIKKSVKWFLVERLDKCLSLMVSLFYGKSTRTMTTMF